MKFEHEISEVDTEQKKVEKKLFFVQQLIYPSTPKFYVFYVVSRPCDSKTYIADVIGFGDKKTTMRLKF